MKRAIVNFAKGAWYPRGQKRLRESLEGNFDGEFLGFTDESEFNSPTHAEVPYAFKPYLIDMLRSEGYDSVLWVDAAAWAERDVQPVFDIIESLGYYFQVNAECGSWCSDVCLQEFGVSRDEAFRVLMLMGCFMGFNLRDERTNRFVDEWLRLAKERKTFVGSHTNHNLEVSSDVRVQGHRHDQSVASLLAYQMNMPLLATPMFQYVYQDMLPELRCRAIFLTQGM